MAKQDKGVGPYAGLGDLKLRRDTTIDDSGNPRPAAGDRRQRGGAFGREISNVDEGDNRGKPAPVTDARFGGGAMTRSVNSPKVRRHGP